MHSELREYIKGKAAEQVKHFTLSPGRPSSIHVVHCSEHPLHFLGLLPFEVYPLSHYDLHVETPVLENSLY